MEINKKNVEEYLTFITKRPTIPDEVENVLIEKKKKFYIDKLVGKTLKNKSAVKKLKDFLQYHYYNSLIQPGETVGIICGQCIGEKTTQSSLNNFHCAGLDTGATSQIDNLQHIINASKIKKKEPRKFFLTTLFFKDKDLSLKNIKEKTNHILNEIKFSDILLNIKFENVDEFSHVEFYLSLEKIYIYKITREIIIKALDEFENIGSKAFSTLDEDDFEYKITCEIKEENLFESVKTLKNKTLIGNPGVKSFVFTQKNNEWCIECLCNDIFPFFKYSDLFDITRIKCNSVNNFCEKFGILATFELIQEKCKDIISDVDSAHFKILAMRMTKNGYIEPLTRYTMRSTLSPLTKASFEESFETFLKASKFKESEKFNSISSAIICGKKPQIGTYLSDVLIDKSFFY